VKYRPERERNLIQYTVEANGCWNPARSKSRKGYLLIKRPKLAEEQIYLHRYSYIIHKGEIPEGSVVMHLCDNPRCFNPEHLVLGTQADNQADAAAKGRFNPRKGEDHGNTDLTAEQVKEIYFSKDTQRELAARYGITQASVSNIRNGKTWGHLGLTRTVVTLEHKQKVEIFKSFDSLEELSERYGVSKK